MTDRSLAVCAGVFSDYLGKDRVKVANAQYRR